MVVVNSKRLFPLLLVIISMVIGGVYYYKINQIPKLVSQSAEQFISIDSLRFNFKAASLSQRGLFLYLESLQTHNSDSYVDSIDSFEAAKGFLAIAYTRDAVFSEQVLSKIDRIITLIEANQYSASVEQITEIKQVVESIILLSSSREREVWESIQADYIESTTNNYILSKVYELLLISLFALLLLGFWHWSRQQKLLKKIQTNETALAQLAYFDSLTQLPNRKQIEQILTQQIALFQVNGTDCFAALVDIDDFKRVNDLLGHAAGDELIKEVAQRVKTQIRDQDSLGRLGGDEFLLVFGEPIDLKQMFLILERIQESFIQPVVLGKNEFYVTISTGVAHLSDINDKKKPVEEIIKFADIAMYEAKRSGKNRFYLYDKAFGEQIEKEHQLDIEIKQALLNDEFELYYQPQLLVSDQSICCVEALIRWNHPNKGFLAPAAFINVVEKGVHAKSVGEWVIKQAVKQQKAWFQQGMDVSISVNLSVKHILSPHFFQSFTQLMHFLQADISRIHLEITEYELIEDHSHGIENLKQIVNAGYKLHLDDFGTGYSSISYLEKLPLHAIKIDKSFVDNISHPQKKGLIEGILTLSQALGLVVVAEGVETPHQADFLMNKGCDFLQGYLIAKPMAAADFVSFYQHFKGLDLPKSLVS